MMRRKKISMTQANICAWGFYRGHPTVLLNDPRYRLNPDYFDDWRYADTLTPTPGNAMYEGRERPCILCNRLTLPGSPDPCLQEFSGVIGACCGHGLPATEGIEQPYVAFANGSDLRGVEALAYFAKRGCGPDARE
jgi:hypothetical protein